MSASSRDVACPACGAKVGKVCRGVVRNSHGERIWAWRHEKRRAEEKKQHELRLKSIDEDPVKHARAIMSVSLTSQYVRDVLRVLIAKIERGSDAG